MSHSLNKCHAFVSIVLSYQLLAENQVPSRRVRSLDLKQARSYLPVLRVVVLIMMSIISVIQTTLHTYLFASTAEEIWRIKVTGPFLVLRNKYIFNIRVVYWIVENQREKCREKASFGVFSRIQVMRLLDHTQSEVLNTIKIICITIAVSKYWHLRFHKTGSIDRSDPFFRMFFYARFWR